MYLFSIQKKFELKKHWIEIKNTNKQQYLGIYAVMIIGLRISILWMADKPWE